MPQNQCERCRRRLLVEAFTKYEFQKRDIPASCKDFTTDVTCVSEKWCKTDMRSMRNHMGG
eukprot:2237137-Pyramimonas_sp.AAC.1